MKNANALLSILFQCFLSIVVFAVNEKSISSCASFFTTQENKRLSGHVVKRLNSGSLLSCGHQCVRNSWCASANFKMPSKENGQGTCELNKHNISVIDGENAQFRGQQGVIFLMFLKGCHQFDSDGVCAITGKSCRDIKEAYPHAPDGMYRIQPDGVLKMFWTYCDMTSFGGGWTMCYSTNNVVKPKVEVTYDQMLPYGTNGYRADCNNIPFREIIFVDEATGQKAFFTYKLSRDIVAATNYGKQFPSKWQGNGVADTNYEYQLLVCDTDFYSGFFISGYTHCSKVCIAWCNDKLTPYFRSAATNPNYAGVAFNINGHSPQKPRLISVGLR